MKISKFPYNRNHLLYLPNGKRLKLPSDILANQHNFPILEIREIDACFRIHPSNRWQFEHIDVSTPTLANWRTVRSTHRIIKCWVLEATQRRPFNEYLIIMSMSRGFFLFGATVILPLSASPWQMVSTSSRYKTVCFQCVARDLGPALYKVIGKVI